MNLEKARLSDEKLTGLYHGIPPKKDIIDTFYVIDRAKRIAQAQLKACEEEAERQHLQKLLRWVNENSWLDKDGWRRVNEQALADIYAFKAKESDD